MAFFNENISEQQHEQETENKALNNDDNQVMENTELEVNRKNREEYENLMDEAKVKLDSYYDKDNIFVKLVLILLFVFIACGIIYYVLLYLRAR